MPALVLKKALMADSGGAGRRRGGLGQVIATRKLADDGKPCQVGIFPNGVLKPVPGLFGGKSGAASSGRIDGPGDTVRDLGVGALTTLEAPAEQAELRIAGGSGYGDPLTRPYREVQHDLDAGYITPDGARRDYGCAVGPDGVIDLVASERLRSGKALQPEPAE